MPMTTKFKRWDRVKHLDDDMLHGSIYKINKKTGYILVRFDNVKRGDKGYWWYTDQTVSRKIANITSLEPLPDHTEAIGDYYIEITNLQRE